MQSVVETEIYLRDAKSAGLSEKERAAIVDFVASRPDAGAEIKGTGGARKLRFAGMTMTKKHTPGQRMIASAKQALAFAEGKDAGCVVHLPDDIDVARIRKKVDMSQRQFAAYFGVVFARTVQEWEQGRAVPSGPSRALLMVIDREPQAVRRALVSFPGSVHPIPPDPQPAHPQASKDIQQINRSLGRSIA